MSYYIFYCLESRPKRGMFCKLRSIYVPLGFVPPVMRARKCLYCCCEKLAWGDAQLIGSLKLKWQRLEQSLPQEITARRPIARHGETVQAIHLHGCGDAREMQTAMVWVKQEPGITQWLEAEKARLTKARFESSLPRVNLSRYADKFDGQCESCPRENSFHKCTPRVVLTKTNHFY